MPITASKNKKSAILTCDMCGEKKSYPSNSPAAPELSACEEAEKDGWAYSIGFFSMLLGHRVLCPKCAHSTDAMKLEGRQIRENEE